VSAVSRLPKVCWFDTRARFDDDDMVLDTSRHNVFVWLPLPLVTRSSCTWRGS